MRIAGESDIAVDIEHALEAAAQHVMRDAGLHVETVAALERPVAELPRRDRHDLERVVSEQFRTIGVDHDRSGIASISIDQQTGKNRPVVIAKSVPTSDYEACGASATAEPPSTTLTTSTPERITNHPSTASIKQSSHPALPILQELQ